MSTDERDLQDHAGDWSPAHFVALRQTGSSRRPACVFRPDSPEQLADALRWANDQRCAVVPYGGGSSVCRGIEVDGGMVVDLEAMNRLRDVDEKAQTCTVEAGMNGAVLRDELASYGLRLGHEPQSIAISTVGGWVATKACGQLSAEYGGIEDLVRGVEAVLPGGAIAPLRDRPRSSVGPDVARLMIGSEGTLGVVTAVSLRLRPAPTEERADAALWFDHMTDGVAACRRIAQSRLHPAVVRLYDADDTLLFLRHRPDLVAGRCVLVVSFEGEDNSARLRAAAELSGGSRGEDAIAAHWWDHRNDAVQEYRKTMAGEGVLGPHGVVDTMEVSGSWSALRGLYHGLKDALSRSAAFVGCHLSHVYSDGACLYFTLAAPCATDHEAAATLDTWWETGMKTCLAEGGSISHHHGIGRLKARWLPQEMGEWWHVLRSVKQALDPNGIMNPGALGL